MGSIIISNHLISWVTQCFFGCQHHRAYSTPKSAIVITVTSLVVKDTLLRANVWHEGVTFWRMRPEYQWTRSGQTIWNLWQIHTTSTTGLFDLDPVSRLEISHVYSPFGGAVWITFLWRGGSACDWTRWGLGLPFMSRGLGKVESPWVVK